MTFHEYKALKWVATVSPYSIQQAQQVWDYFRKKYPQSTWEDILKRVAAILFLCSRSGMSVSVVLNQMQRADKLGNPWPI